MPLTNKEDPTLQLNAGLVDTRGAVSRQSIFGISKGDPGGPKSFWACTLKNCGEQTRPLALSPAPAPTTFIQCALRQLHARANCCAW